MQVKSTVQREGGRKVEALALAKFLGRIRSHRFDPRLFSSTTVLILRMLEWSASVCCMNCINDAHRKKKAAGSNVQYP